MMTKKEGKLFDDYLISKGFIRDGFDRCSICGKESRLLIHPEVEGIRCSECALAWYLLREDKTHEKQS